jgi:hypothetical protein
VFTCSLRNTRTRKQDRMVSRSVRSLHAAFAMPCGSILSHSLSLKLTEYSQITEQIMQETRLRNYSLVLMGLSECSAATGIGPEAVETRSYK